MRAYERLHATGPEFDGFPDQLTVLVGVAHLRQVPTSPSPPTGAISSVLFLNALTDLRTAGRKRPRPGASAPLDRLGAPSSPSPSTASSGGGDEIADAGQLFDGPVQDFGSCPRMSASGSVPSRAHSATLNSAQERQP